jgi:O-glycosyl hydrolase
MLRLTLPVIVIWLCLAVGCAGRHQRAGRASQPQPRSCAGGPTNIVIASGSGTSPSASQTITIDGTGAGRVFDGIGAVSGGGGNSRLLFDYAEPYRSQILDYLFKPQFAAALQILKVEIGGDMNSTDGAEASHMHTANDVACNRGYEWWLMKAAKARNPAIKLYGLAWGAPGWIGKGNFWSPDMINYLLKWLQCAQTNGLNIDYLGGWNERGTDNGWFARLHAALKANGYGAVKVVGTDNDWAVADDMLADPTFNAAIDILGAHYPCGGDGAEALACASSAEAINIGKPLWASENGSQDYNSGAPALIRSITRGYIDAQMTAYINWPLVAALAPNLPWPTMGLMLCNEPWSGAFVVGKQVWASAHVTQFVQPGWSFIAGASGYFAGDPANGSYVSFKAPTNRDYTILIETTKANVPQTVAFKIAGGLANGAAHIWATDLSSAGETDSFVHGADVTPDATGTFWITLVSDHIYTIATTRGQCHGTAASPAHAPLPLPHDETFESAPVGSLPPLLGDQDGAFEIAACGGGRNGQCYRQMTPVAPIGWATPHNPYALLGTNDWTDYTISVDLLFEQAGSAEVIGRFGARDYYNTGWINAYYLSVTDKGAWSILRNAAANGKFVTLAQGNVAALGLNRWHRIALTLNGSRLSAAIDGTRVGSTNDSTYTAGPAGLSVGAPTSSWLNVQFDNLSIAPPAQH